jgi:hypothetical protein
MEYVLHTSPLCRGGELLLEGSCPPPNFDALSQEMLLERMRILDPLVKMLRVVNASNY